MQKMPAFMPEDSKLSLAMAYVPFQMWKDLYEMDVAMDRGTIFEGLDKPFLGNGVIFNEK